jgi:hypothetical protein
MTLFFECNPTAEKPTIVNTLDDYAACRANFRVATALACGDNKTTTTSTPAPPAPQNGSAAIQIYANST